MVNGHAAVLDGRVLHLRTPTFKEYRFEWHQGKQAVYLIRLARPSYGEAIANEVHTHAAALNAVTTFLRGVREGRAAPPPPGEINWLGLETPTP